MRGGTWILALGLAAALAAPARAGDDICARGARIETLPLSYLLETEAAAIHVAAYGRVNWADPDDGTDLMFAPQAPHLRDILAERSAALPPAQRDLPYLILLADLERYPEGVIDALTLGGESAAAARFLDAMDRQGLAIEAQLLREAVGLFPDWGATPRDRAGQVYPQSGDLADSALRRALWALGARWPAGGRAAAAAEALIGRDPGTAADHAARLAAVSQDDRLSWLVQSLWRDCLDDWWTPEEADRAFFSIGTAQAALLMLDAFLSENLNGSAGPYFAGASGTMAPHLARVLDRRGLRDHAAAIRRAMALFPAPYPRDTERRQSAMEGFTPQQQAVLDAVTGIALDGALRAEMLLIAREAGLLPLRP